MKKIRLVFALVGILTMGGAWSHALAWEFPFWQASETNSVGAYTDPDGNTWAAWALNNNDNGAKPGLWSRLILAGTNTSGEVTVWKRSSVYDQAPGWFKTKRSLRGAQHNNCLAAFTFEAGQSGQYRLTGNAFASCWSGTNAGKPKVVVSRIASGVSEEIYSDELTVAGRYLTLVWDTIAEVQEIFLKKGDMISFVVRPGSAGTTSSLEFGNSGGASSYLTEIIQLNQPSAMLIR